MEEQKQDKAERKSDVEHTKQVQAAGWTAGLAAFFIVGALTANASWPMAVACIAVAGMVAAACYFMLKPR
jgi:hypothetical protein